MVQASDAGEEEAHLREFAGRHAVRFEVYPEKEMVDGKIVRVGFDLQLYGLHEHPKGVLPGCPECTRVYAAMREIARWILPTEGRASRYEVEGFSPSLYMAPDVQDRDEVRLEVKILHRHDFFSPIDKCEERCLGEMKQKLGRIGVREGRRRAGTTTP